MPAKTSIFEIVKNRNHDLHSTEKKGVRNNYDLILDTLLSDNSYLGETLKEGDIDFFLELGRELLTKGDESSKACRPDYENSLYKFLNLARSNPILKNVDLHGKQDDWFELILAMIQETNFTIGKLLKQRVEQYGAKPIFKTIKGRQVTSYSMAEIQCKVYAIARSLLRLSSNNSPARPVAILSENSIEMVCIDLACLITGIVNVPIPANSTSQNIEFILNHSKANIIFVSQESQLNELLKIRGKLNNLQHIVMINAPNGANDTMMIALEEFLNQGKNVPDSEVLQAIDRVKIDDLATIMYTSGTTEAPKGIMFSQLNIVSKRFARAIALPEIGDQDSFVCYLPLFHTFGRYFEMMGCIFWGATYVFLENVKIETIIENMRLVKPTVFISIPKKWMQLFEKIQEKVDTDIADHSEIQAVVSNLTGGKLKWGLSAAGYLDPDIFRFFQNFGIEIMSGFGMTEATGGITMTPPFKYRINSVGKALPGIEIKLADDGEMLIKGPYVMMGYLNLDSDTFENGWLHTGDIFSKDSDGYFQILDRKKEIYKNIKGETISPQKIENLFHDFDSIKQVFLVGDHREYNTLLLYPNFEYDQLNFEELSHEKLREFFSSLIVSVNQFLAPYERIVDFAIIDREFKNEKDELTPKGTYKRKVVEENFREIIARMYQEDYAFLKIDDFEIRIPNWFLREKALTSDDLKVEETAIILKPTTTKLRVQVFEKTDPRILQIGDFYYSTDQDFLDLGEIIRNAKLWIGNVDLVNFVGDSIFRLFQIDDLNDQEIKLEISKKAPGPEQNIIRKLNNAIKKHEDSLEGIHLSAYIIQTWHEKYAVEAINYLEQIMQKQTEKTSKLANLVLMRSSECDNNSIKKRAFKVLILNEKSYSYIAIFEAFLRGKNVILDEETISDISNRNLTKKQLKGIVRFLNERLEKVKTRDEKLSEYPIASLLNLITSYGIKHPITFKTIRTELVKWPLFEIDKSIKEHAKLCIDELQRGFRNWLGANLQIAIDPERAHEFSWSDVLTFEEEIDPEDREKISNAIRECPLIREAIFLFSGGNLIRLQEIPHKGIWVSFLGSLHGKSVYRVTVQTHHYGSFDLAININKSLSPKEVESEINWLICAGAAQDKKPLVEDFGGYWPEYDLWTEEFIPGETVEKYLRRLERQTEKHGLERILLLWPSFVWSGLSAYVDFWDRTGRQLEIADPTPANVIVPFHDYQVGFRIVSISDRKPFESIFQMILSFRRNFILSMESKYEDLKGKCSWHVIFSAFLEILGEDEGLQTLENALLSFDKNECDEETTELTQKLTKFIENVQRKGYRPNRLHFAIKRFERWYKLNPEATPQARIQTLKDLSTTYLLDKIEQKYPGSRIQFFRDTAFAKSDERIIEGLNKILQNIKNKKTSSDNLPEQLLELRSHTDLSEEEKIFLTRLTYPHLGAEDSAELISVTSQGTLKTALVVFIEDSDGNRLGIRHPATPKEIARLHRLFTIANLPVEFKPEHQFLVIINERSQVIGGLFYRQVEPKHVHLEKIVVDEHHRRKNVSDGLMKEFFNRLQSERIEIVTVGFFRPEYFYKFGFKIDQSYGNMVKKLEPEMTTEHASDIMKESLV